MARINRLTERIRNDKKAEVTLTDIITLLDNYPAANVAADFLEILAGDLDHPTLIEERSIRPCAKLIAYHLGKQLS